PDATWKEKELTDFTARQLLEPIFQHGELVNRRPALQEIKAYCAQQVDSLWEEVQRFENPHHYYVDLSQKLWNIKNDLLREKR
ncbi:MAG: nicotinate phosphoribosyltransferase, partial [Oscillospiraceae bacterium]|nr:nicotinate phosphoribosyltransferase [Oscillospiraceae bacterium]